MSGVRGEEGLAAATFLALPVSMKSARRSIPEPESNRVSGQSDERKETKIKGQLHNHVSKTSSWLYISSPHYVILNS